MDQVQSPTWEQLTLEQQYAVDRLFRFLRRMHKAGKIGGKREKASE